MAKFNSLKIEKLITVPIMIRKIVPGFHNRTIGVGFFNMNIMKESGRIYASINEGRKIRTYRPIPMDVMEKIVEIRRAIKPIHPRSLNRMQINQEAIDKWTDKFKEARAAEGY